VDVESLESRTCVWCGVVTRGGLSSLSESMVTTFPAVEDYVETGVVALEMQNSRGLGDGGSFRSS